MINGLIQEDIPIINIYAPNTGAPEYVRQIQTTIKRESDSKKIILGDFNIPLIPRDRSSTKKMNISISLKSHIRLDGPFDIFSIFHHQTAEYIFFFLKCTGNTLWNGSQHGSHIKPCQI